MKTRGAVLASAGTLLITALTTGAAPAHAADWRTGWCVEDEGLSVVVDFGASTAATVPTEGWLVRCLVGGEIQADGRGTRVAALRAVGLGVEADRGGYVTAIDGVEEFDPDGWWFFSGATVGGPWDTAYHDIVSDGPNLNKALGARLVGDDWVNVPRPAPQFGQPEPDPEPKPDPAVAGSTPLVTGRAQVGVRLTADAGSWSAGASLGYQWLRGNQPIVGATRASHVVTAADRGRRLRVRVSGTLAGYTTTVLVSAPTASVAAGTLTSARPKITGRVKVGQRLQAKPGAWGPGTVRFTYRWLRNGKPLAATARNYRLRPADRGTRITVRVTGRKAGYVAVTRASAKSVRVKG
ncbi:hypothetical protein [Nocardioides ochotonae]|uniref:hypothetical protein n=1 Tax=Nocardioides ochotonae TaxID=2685869 RepID=UPI00140B65D6|nr:hypothetical protein [Nocardioides ochotonae]